MAEKTISLNIPLGLKTQQVCIPRSQFVGAYLPKQMPIIQDPEAEVRRSVREAVETTGLRGKVKPGAKACIAITDRTRPTPNSMIVPVLLQTLNDFGIIDRDITVIVGVGMHAPDSPEAIRQNVGEAVLDRVEVINSDPDDEEAMILIGETSLGTPIEVDHRFAKADVKIGTGNVTPCMLAGWSGGGKIVLPGVVSRRTIYENHKRFTGILQELGYGSLIGIMPPKNVVRADIEEAATKSGIDLVVNTVLDSQSNLVAVYSGDPLSAHRRAVEKLRPYVEVEIPQEVDVMVTGVGELSYEVSLFQGGSRVCGSVDRHLKNGGTLIMANECREGIYEGFEHDEFRDWMQKMPTPAKLRELTESLEIGGEKSCVLHAFSWLIHEKKCRIITVTDHMSQEELKEVHLDYAPTIQRAFDDAYLCHGKSASIAAMPFGALVLPTS
ncbi:MAG: nickel-dependent lactate racemase [Proteobacteria bacterium]|nr:nickel-dependent lactate racemase [Pseudomonadota bacterium]